MKIDIVTWFRRRQEQRRQQSAWQARAARLFEEGRYDEVEEALAQWRAAGGKAGK